MIGKVTPKIEFVGLPKQQPAIKHPSLPKKWAIQNGVAIILSVSKTGNDASFRQITKTNKPLSKPPKNVSPIWFKLSNVKAIF